MDFCTPGKNESCCFGAIDDTTPCRPPPKLNGLDIEIAVRREPFKNYPPKIAPKLPEIKRVSPLKAEDELASPPKCSPRYYLRRIYQVLVQLDDESPDDDVWALWKSYEKEAADVFIYGNLDVVAKIILVLSISCKHFTEYQELFDRLMQRLQRGVYLGPSVSKELNDTKKMTFFFSCLGVAIVEGHMHAQTCVASILSVWLENILSRSKKTAKKLRCFFSSKLMKGSKQLTTRVPDYILLRSLENSLLATTIAKNIKIDMQIDAYLFAISLLRLCCDVSSAIRERLWCLDLLDIVFSRLTHPDPSNRILVKSTDFIYAYFGVYGMYEGEDKTANVIPRLSKDAFQVLLQRFLKQIDTHPRSPSQSLLSIRNDTAFLICLICKRVPFCGEYFQNYGLTIASLITNVILGTQEPDNKLYLESTSEDLELLQLMIFMLKSIVETGLGERMIRKYNLVSVLLTLILGPCSLTKGDPVSGKSLENTAWSTIQTIAKRFPMFLLTQHGASSLLEELKTFGSSGEGNQATLAMSMHTLRIMLTSLRSEEDAEPTNLKANENLSEEAIIYLKEREAMAILLRTVYRLMDYEDFGLLSDTMISNALYCCAILGDSDLGEKEFFMKLDGVPLLTMIMRHLTRNPAEKRHIDSVMQMALAECICGCVAHYPSSLETFLECEGVLRTLDVLEMAASSEATVHLMNCIVQLCDYPRCMDQLLSWKRPMRNTFHQVVFGDGVDQAAKSLLFAARDAPKSGDNLLDLETGVSDLTLGSLLCSIWRDDEKRGEVLRDPEGCIASIAHPLMTKKARTYDVDSDDVSEVADDTHKSSIDMSKSALRPKIYLLIKRIIEKSNTTATIFDGLSLINQIMMQVIINFMDLKKAEVFTDMDHTMHQYGLPFAPEDEADASLLITVAKNTVATVLETQRYLLRRWKENEAMKETEFYTLVKQCCLQDHLLATREVDYLARTTNYDYLVEKRLWQRRELEVALKNLDMSSYLKTSRIHRTSDGFLNITAWSYRTKYVESEPKIKHSRNESSEGDTEVNDDSRDVSTNAATWDMESTVTLKTETVDPSRFSMTMASSMGTNVYASSAMLAPEKATPENTEGGFYQISPYLLRQALSKLVAFKSRCEWINLVDQDDENQWKVRKKWREDWYPLTRIKKEDTLPEGEMEDEEEEDDENLSSPGSTEGFDVASYQS